MLRDSPIKMICCPRTTLQRIEIRDPTSRVSTLKPIPPGGPRRSNRSFAGEAVLNEKRTKVAAIEPGELRGNRLVPVRVDHEPLEIDAREPVGEVFLLLRVASRKVDQVAKGQIERRGVRADRSG